jgi:hypothetical protein
MSAIAQLRSRISDVTEIIRASGDPVDFASRLELHSMEAHLEELRQQLRTELMERSIEVVQVRLIGEAAHAGSIPLILLARLSSQFADAIHAASQRIKSGRQVVRISQAIVDLLGLRLVDLAPGSTRLFISGSTSPDLFGNSLLGDSLQETFQIFEAEGDDDLAEAVSQVGIRSARGIREFLGTLKAAELSVELAWRTPDDKEKRWEGSYQSVSRLSRSLGNFKVSEATSLTVTGVAVTLSARGRFEIEGDGRIYAGRFPADVLEMVQEIHIGQSIIATLERTVVFNTVTGVQKVDFTLLRIAPTEQGMLQAEA